MQCSGNIPHSLERLRKLHVGTQRDSEFLSHLNRLLKHDDSGSPLPEAQKFTATGETRGVLVIDGPGGGKSTLVARALQRHPVLAMGAEGRPLYLDAIVPSPATFKSMGLELLEKSGYPLLPGRREAWGIWQLLRTRLQLLGVVVLWIDEAHDLFCADRGLILRAIKSLMQGDEAVVVVLSGTERMAEIVRSDPQVQRRFSTMILPPVSAATDGDQFLEIIDGYCAKVDLEPPSVSDLIDRLFHASRYRFGRCIEAILGAIEVALEEGSSQLDIDHFATAWARQEGCAIGHNIFLVSHWSEIDPDAEEQQSKPSRRKPKRR